MGKLVTDPALLAELNGQSPQIPVKPKAVTDQALLAELNAATPTPVPVSATQSVDPNAPSPLGSFTRGVVHGGMANFDDEAAGVANAGLSILRKAQGAVNDLVTKGKVPTPLRDALVRYIKTFEDVHKNGAGQAISSLAKDVYGSANDGAFGMAQELVGEYTKGRDYVRDWQNKDEATNPYSYLAGQLTGGVGTLAVPGGGLGGMIRAGVTGAARQAAGKGAVRGLENIGNAGKAVEASREAMSAGAPTFFQKLLGNTAEGAAIGGLYGAGAGEGVQDTAEKGLYGTMLGGAAGAAIPAAMGGISKIARAPAKLLLTKNAPAIAKAATDEGVDLTAGMVGNKLLGITEGAIGMMPGGINTISSARDNVSKQLGNRFQEVASKFGTSVGKEEAGLSLQTGGQKWLETSRQEAERAYNKLDNLVPKDMPAELPNTSSYLTEIADKFGGNIEFQKVLEAPIVSKYRNLLVTGQPVPYEILKNLRTEIGKKISVPSLAPDENRAALEGLYGSLSADMEGAAAKVPGGPEALKAANDLWRNRSEQIKGVYTKILGQDAPEKVFNAALNGSRDGGTKLRQLKNVVGDEAWGDFVGANLRNIGTKVDPETEVVSFDPFKFISQIKQFSPEARQAMFGSKGPELLKNLQNLEKLSGAYTRSVLEGANKSGTAKVGVHMAGASTLGGSLAAGPAGLGYAIGGLYAAPFVASKLMTNPKFVQWLARSAIRQPTKEGFGPHLARLEIIRRNSDPETSKAIEQYKSNLPEIQ